MIRVIVITLFLFQSITAVAQFMDTIRESIKYKPKIIYRGDSQNSFISTRRSQIKGFRIGVEFHNVFRVGGGYHWIDRTSISKDVFIYENDKIIDTVSAGLKLRYLGYYVEYVFYNTDRWQLSLPIQLGFGSTFLQYPLNGKKYNTTKKFVMVYETNISGYVKVVPGMGFGIGIGYRFMPIGNKAYDQNFNSPVYIIKFKVFFGDLFKKFIGDKKLPGEDLVPFDIPRDF